MVDVVVNICLLISIQKVFFLNLNTDEVFYNSLQDLLWWVCSNVYLICLRGVNVDGSSGHVSVLIFINIVLLSHLKCLLVFSESYKDLWMFLNVYCFIIIKRGLVLVKICNLNVILWIFVNRMDMNLTLVFFTVGRSVLLVLNLIWYFNLVFFFVVYSVHVLPLNLICRLSINV